MAKKLLRDPNAPKRNMSAYLLYQNGMREQFKAQNPGMTFGQLAKYTSAMYAEMPPAEKEAWIARAESDKARYLHELASYIPPPGYDSKGDAIIAPQIAPPKKRGKAGRDANAPKRNLSAYLLFQNAMRDQYKRENPGMTFGQLAKYTSHMYKNLTPEEKQTWVARAEQDKARYDSQIAVYVSPPGHDAHGNLIDVAHGGSKRQKRSLKDPAAPKRARGSFVFFTFEMRPQVMTEFPGIKFVEMGTILGERWRALTPEQKKRYEDMAAEDKVRFHLEMQKYTGHLNQLEAQAQAAALQQQQQHQQMMATHHQQQQISSTILHEQYYQDPSQQQTYDPNQYDPNQPQYDPNQPGQQYDPNQPQQQYDPNQPGQQYDPNQPQAQQYHATQQQYDPNQPQAQQFEQAQQFDPNQPQAQQYEQGQQFVDPNQPQAQQYEQTAQQQFEQGQQFVDPNQQPAQQFEQGQQAAQEQPAQYYDPQAYHT